MSVFCPQQDDSEFPPTSPIDTRINLDLDDDIDIRGGSRKPGRLLEYIPIGNCHLHSFSCWGFCLVRTCYAPGDDARVTAAVAKLAALIGLDVASDRQCYDELHCQLPEYSIWDKLTGERAVKEALERYHNVLLQDREKLDGATVETATQFFNDWAEPLQMYLEEFRGPRAEQFILLDEETLRNIEAIPVAVDADVAAWLTWKNEASNSQTSREEERGRFWLRMFNFEREMVCRVWIWDFVELFLWLVFDDAWIAVHKYNLLK